jgi:hypothetical protein
MVNRFGVEIRGCGSGWVAAGGIHQLMRLLNQPDAATQVAAAKALADVVRDCTNTAPVVAAGAVPVNLNALIGIASA